MIPDTTCPITVAQAAPAIPMWKPKIKVGSRIVLMIAPVKVQVMENFGLPSARTRFVPPVVKIKNGNQRDVIPV